MTPFPSSPGSTLALLSATMRMESDEMILVCEASGEPTPMIIWDARLSRMRSPLPTTSNNYEISQEVNGNTVESTLSFNPNDVGFMRPECIIQNGIDTLRVREAEFEMVEAPTMMTGETPTLITGTVKSVYPSSDSALDKLTFLTIYEYYTYVYKQFTNYA